MKDGFRLSQDEILPAKYKTDVSSIIDGFMAKRRSNVTIASVNRSPKPWIFNQAGDCAGNSIGLMHWPIR